MASIPNGKSRLWGATAQRYMTELRRQAVVAAAEINNGIAADNEFPATLSVLRREKVSDGVPSAGIDAAWTLVAGMTNIVGKIRTNGRWLDRESGTRIWLGQNERIVLLMDIPAGGNGEANELFLTDRVSFDDPVKGQSVWEILDVYVSKRDGIASARVRYAKEDYSP